MYTVDLQGQWTVRRADEERVLDAVVPGDVHLDLLRAGEIPDPFFRDNEDRLHWIGDSDWVYSRSFTVPADVLKADRLLLRCEGLDTLAEVSVNGRSIGSADNMFRTWEWDVADALREGENEIAVLFRSINPEIAERQAEGFYAVGGGGTLKKFGTSQIRKEQCNSGWDWGPCCVTCGIWRPIGILAYDQARLTDVEIRQTHGTGGVHLSVGVELERAADSEAALLAEVRLCQGGAEVCRAEASVSGEAAASELTVEAPRLWWPNGMGAQNLYELAVELKDVDGTVLDTRRRRIGLRTIELVEEEDEWGRSFHFRVNGVRFFAKGANWIPADVFQPRVSEAKYRDLLQSAVDVHMNMIRIWGGGIYEEDRFYDLCDELGLLVWQDFMYACAAYPASRPSFLANARREAEDNVRRLRHHPCIALYCGNNELEQCNFVGGKREGAMTGEEYSLLFDETLPAVVKQLHPEIPYTPSSGYTPDDRGDPFAEHSGDVHFWHVWNRRQPLEWYRSCLSRFCSEFGFQSFPEPRTCEAFTAPEDRNINSYVMNWHQRNVDGNPKAIHYILQWHWLPSGLENTIWLSQIMQGLAIKYGVEHWRRHMPRCMGALYWQLNDCWPVASWASIDYFGRWKAEHYMARRFFAPVLLSCLEDTTKGTLELHVTSDLPQSAVCEVRWTATDARGKTLEEGRMTASTPVNGSACVKTLDLQNLLEKHTPRDVMVWLELALDGEVVSENFVTFARPKDFVLPNPEIAVDVSAAGDGSFTVECRADAPALWTWLSLRETDARFSDNFVCMRPGAPRMFTAHPAEPLTEEQFTRQLQARSLYDLYQ